MNKTYFLFAVIALGVLGLGIVFAGAGFLTYIDWASALVILFTTAALLVCSFRLREIGSYFAAAFRGRGADTSTLKKGIGFFLAMQRYLIISAVLATMIGIIALLSVLGDPTYVSKGLALALLSILYAVTLILVVALPFRTSLERKLAEAEGFAGTAQQGSA
ncbi:MAG: hypothetical protein E4H36_12605 [Spirochaetales bacterium]|nr:MAG: hypothetical protein E4H36_12605 [Spirochaetales bacterium]